ncbi:riboflavin synthase [Paenibacillus terreus]|uniref:Riboflavin synthase n=1 Tax=Paenibacillus terreus TaxID=1387834 RepID=A0ABV5B202_9BACL
MFTGLIEEVGILRKAARSGEAMELEISAAVVLEDLKIGDSVSVNGVCLTATKIGERSFTVDVMPQTYRHSNLSELQSGNPLNLERAMAAGGRFGGHIVQGHVDGTGRIVRITRDQNAVVYEIMPDDDALFKYLVPRGSVTIDGISLTVAQLYDSSFAVSIIPHTLEATALRGKRAGNTVNIECDILGKYVEHLLFFSRKDRQTQAPKQLDLEFLAEHGFS